MRAADVLVAGAGPTGLVLALWLARFGVRVRIVEKAVEPLQTSRAIGVQARTLELYRQMGLARGVLDDAWAVQGINLWTRGERRAHLDVGSIGGAISPFPRVWMYPQHKHERLLAKALESAGVSIERGTELVSFEQRDGSVNARLVRQDGTVESCEVQYLAGCDGARSAVRRGMDVDFGGGTYDHLFYVADIDGKGPAANGELHVALDDADFLAIFPLDGHGTVRLIGTVRERPGVSVDGLRWEDVNRKALVGMPLDVERVNWFSTYHVHHRVASRFRDGRVFLLGDAAHIHSPVGAQGMNTGLGDSINLAWKLAAALRDRASAPLLDTYEAERIAFARRLVHTTDRIFQFVTRDGGLAARVRVDLAPPLLSAASRMNTVQRFVFKTVSQTTINYRGSALSAGHVGRVFGGDRLPWVAGSNGKQDDDNFTPLTSNDWQVHVYGDVRQSLVDACAAMRLPLHTFAFNSAAENTGLTRDASYLVRPDGYVALAASGEDATTALAKYMASHRVAVRGSAGTGEVAARPEQNHGGARAT